MRESEPSESQLKNEEFKRQIRARLKADHMRKIRNEFLRIEQEGQFSKKLSSDLAVADLEGLIAKPATQKNLAMLNRFIITNRHSIKQVQYMSLISYTKFNFLDQSPVNLLERVELNDFIALLSNIMAIQNYHQKLVQQINPEQVFDKLLAILEKASVNTGSLLLWVLYQMMQIFPLLPVYRIGELQGWLWQKFTLLNIYLSYLLCGLAENRPDLLDEGIIEEYTQMGGNAHTEYSFFENIIVIFGMFVINKGDSPQTHKILRWAGDRLISTSTLASTKSSLLRLINHIIKSNLGLALLKQAINHSPMIYEIIQRSLYDTQSDNKLICIDCLNDLVKLCPKMDLHDLLESYPSIVEAIASSLTLLNLNVVVASLGSIGKIIMLRPDDPNIRDMLCDRGFKTELESLQYSKNQQISNMATILLQEYLQ